MTLVDLTPAIDAGFGFFLDAAAGIAEKFGSVVARGDLAIAGASESFDHIAAQQFIPIKMKEVAGGEDVAPGDFAAVGYDDADDAFTFESGSGAGEAALDFFDVSVSGSVDALDR